MSNISRFDDNFSSALQDTFESIGLHAKSPGREWDRVWKVSHGEFTGLTSQDVAKRLRQKLATVPKHEDAEWLLTAPHTPGGFPVDVSYSGGFVRGLFGELEREFDNPQEAITWFARALDSSYRLRVVSFGGTPAEWYLEPTATDRGDARLAYGRPQLFGFMRKRSEVIYQNRVLGM